MNIKSLKSVIDYAMNQVISSQVSILDDTTGHGYESADYYEMQVAELREMQLTINNVHEAMTKAFDENETEVTVTSSLELENSLFILLYDSYGELYRKNHNKAVTFEEYYKATKLFMADTITESQWHSVWEFTVDMFDENEAEGSNDSLGHFVTT